MTKKEQVQAIFDESRNGCNQYIRHPLARKLIYSDGIKEVADAAGAYWFLDIVGTEIAPKLLKRFEDDLGNASCEVILTVADDKAEIEVIGWYKRKIEMTDFPEGQWSFELAVDGLLDPGKLVAVLILPTEH